jgi:transcription antitermination factor NusG
MGESPNKKVSDNKDAGVVEPVYRDSVVQDKYPWYAIRLYTNRQKQVADYFKEHELECFIPMQYVDFEDREGHRKRELRPVVRNLLFVKKTITDKEMLELSANCTCKLSVLKKNRMESVFYEIPPKQMFEFRMMCNPEIELRKFISEEEAQLKNGAQVNVCFGPLKGLSGKLVRQSHKYYLLKEVPGMGVMIKVSRWCCKPVEEQKNKQKWGL